MSWSHSSLLLWFSFCLHFGSYHRTILEVQESLLWKICNYNLIFPNTIHYQYFSIVIFLMEEVKSVEAWWALEQGPRVQEWAHLVVLMKRPATLGKNNLLPITNNRTQFPGDWHNGFLHNEELGAVPITDCQLEFPSFRLQHKGGRAEEEPPREAWEESRRKGRGREQSLPGLELCPLGSLSGWKPAELLLLVFPW